MATTKTAIAGMNRGLAYVEAVLNSDSSLYAPGVCSLQEIKALADKISQLAEIALEEKPKNRHILSKTESEISNSSSENYTSVHSNVVTFPDINRANTTLNLGNPKSESFEFGEPNNFTENRINAKEFKAIIRKVAELPQEKFKSIDSKNCAEYCAEYFDTRFTPRYDPNGLHKFDLKKFGHYLKSFVLGYAVQISSSSVAEFDSKFRQWVDSVKQGNNPYSFPKFVAPIFFALNQNNAIRVSSAESVLYHSIWEELWDLGYSKLEHIPVFDNLNTLGDSNIDISDDSYESIFNQRIYKYKIKLSSTDLSVLQNTYFSYITFTLNPAYRIFKLRVAAEFEHGYDSDPSPSDIADSLVRYVATHRTKLSELHERVEEINHTADCLSVRSKSIDDLIPLVASSPVESLDLIEVFCDQGKYSWAK